MFYRHYKGGLYFLEGYATPFSDTLHNKDRITIEVVAVAKYEETQEDVNVLSVYDKGFKSTYFAYNNSNLSGVLCFYRGVDGRYWLRDRDKFYEDVEVKVENGLVKIIPRFERINGEHLFDTISDLYNEWH